jgi:hypothetical protein
MGNLSRLTWQDAYYDGNIDERYEVFCEENQNTYARKGNDGWDTHTSSDKRYEDDFSYERKLMSGEIKRIR